MAKEWDKNQYNKSIPAVENKIGNNSLWVVVTVIIEVYNDVIIKYFILICFLVTSLGEIDLFLSSEFEARNNAQYYGLMIVYQ